MSKRIRVIIPNITSEFNDEVLEILSLVKDEDTELDVCNIKGEGATYLNQNYDVVRSALSVLKEAEVAEEEGFDGVMVYCALDPARSALKEALAIPVVSILEVALHTAAMLGNHFSILCPPGSIVAREELVSLYRMEERLNTVEIFDLEIRELCEDNGAKYRQVKQAAQCALEKGSDCLVLGCGAMLGIAERLSRELEVPVIEPGPISLKYCESLISLKLSHSKIAYPSPIFTQF